MKTPLLASLPFLTALAFGAVLAPPAAADDCDDSSSGFGDETAACNYSCQDNQFVGVLVSVDDAGSVSGTTSCGGAGANCAGVSKCNDLSDPVRTANDGWGSCSGTGNGGAWTRVAVKCWTQDAGAAEPSGDKVDPRIKVNGDLLDGLAGAASFALIELEDGVASGLACGPGGCRTVVPVCETLGDAWACRL